MNSGVYKIINLINNKLYVGSSSNLRKRERDHFTELERGVHKNKHLQSAYKLYNKDSFKFELIENCINDELIKREQFWIDQYDFDQLYNMCPIAGSHLGRKNSEETKLKMSHKVFTVEHKHKISQAMCGKKNRLGIKHSEETKNKFRGVNNHEYGKKRDPEHSRKISKANQKEWIFNNPGGEEVKLLNLKQFCLVNNLDHGNMYRVANGKRKQHKGWTRNSNV